MAFRTRSVEFGKLSVGDMAHGAIDAIARIGNCDSLAREAPGERMDFLGLCDQRGQAP
jgi:hypothetical protein